MKRALQLVLAIGFVGLVLAAAVTTREVLGAASPAFAWPSPRGTFWGYPTGFFDLVLYAAIVTVALVGLVASYRGDHATPGARRRRRYAPPFRPAGPLVAPTGRRRSVKDVAGRSGN